MLAALAASFVPLVAAAPFLGLHVPWADGAEHWNSQGIVVHEAEPWPDFPIDGARLWDTRTTWAHLEPVDDQWQFATLEAHLDAAESAGVGDVLLVLTGTPAWAARDPDAQGAPWLPTGSASPPRDRSDWRDYVRTVAERYGDRIDAYQVGHEPNLAWFWQGTPRQMARLVSAAVEEIRQVDPTATVVGPGPVVTDPASAVGAGRWWRAMAGTGIDALALQWYPRKGASPASLAPITDRLRYALAGSELEVLPVWITEVNHRGVNADLVPGTMRAAGRVGIERVYWYAWTDVPPPGLLRLQEDSAAGRALARYAEATSRAR
jgi:hypothetical protein